MLATAWNSGGDQYGIRVGIENREWLAKHKSLHWPKGSPPKVRLIPLGNGKFQLLP